MTQHILVATDGSDTADKALDMAARLSVGLKLDVSIVHVLMHGRPSDEWLRMAEIEHLIKAQDITLDKTPGVIPTAQAVVALGNEILARAQSRVERAGARKVTTQTLVGDYADEILDLIAATPPEIVVLGDRGLGRVRRAILGSVSHKVVQLAPCSVMVVR